MPVKNTNSLKFLNQLQKWRPKHIPNGVEELHFELTYRCSSQCIMCDIWRKNLMRPKLRKKELTQKEIKKFIIKSKLLNQIKKVILSGGEPFLRDDLVEICGFFVQRYPDVSIDILTSLINKKKVLTQTKRIIEQCHPKDLWLGSSLDGVGSVHDMVRGRKGAFDSLVNTIMELQTRFSRIHCCLTFTLTPNNHKELLSAYHLAKKLKCWFGAQFVVQKENTDKFCWDKKQLKIIENQVNVIIKKETALCGAVTPEIIFWKNLVKYARKPKRYLKYCSLGRKIAMFDPWGKLYVCPVHKEMEIGSIREKSFDELWLSKKANKIRKYIDQGKCHCWLYCSVMPILNEAFRMVP